MIKTTTITNVDELLKLWPRLLSLTVKQNTPITTDQLLRLLLHSLEHGAVFIVRGDSGVIGLCCVECVKNSVVLRMLPKDGGQRIGKECLQGVSDWAKSLGHKTIQVSTTNLCGSSFRYFEKTLGFHRHTVTFTKELV